jgi:hypothetical protein
MIVLKSYNFVKKEKNKEVYALSLVYVVCLFSGDNLDHIVKMVLARIFYVAIFSLQWTNIPLIY